MDPHHKHKKQATVKLSLKTLRKCRVATSMTRNDHYKINLAQGVTLGLIYSEVKEGLNVFHSNSNLKNKESTVTTEKKLNIFN
jgi:hypothetical protein